jgi:hypothetical protein
VGGFGGGLGGARCCGGIPRWRVLKLRYFFCIFPGEIDILKILAMCKTSPGVSPC